MLGDNETVGEVVTGRINTGDDTALCNMMTYNAARDWDDSVKRDDCDRYFDASSDGSFMAIGASIIGLVGRCVFTARTHLD